MSQHPKAGLYAGCRVSLKAGVGESRLGKGAPEMQKEIGFRREQSFPRLPIVIVGRSVSPKRPAEKLVRLRPDAASGGPRDVLG
jgi:hypothetical protein